MKIKLVIGLGNPEKTYKNTYHNIGFLFVDYLDNSQTSDIGCQTLKSKTYMNQSGSFIKKALKKYKIKLDEILIVHDDSDIELGKYKLSFGRGSAGHKGIESIIKTVKTKDFWRLRIGIRPKASRKKADLPAEAHRAKAGEFVLKKINKKDLVIFTKVFQDVQKIIFSQ